MLGNVYHCLWIICGKIYKLTHSKMVFRITMLLLNKESNEYIKRIYK